MREPLLPPHSFHGLEETTHLCTGGESPWLKSHDDVYKIFVAAKSAGFEGRETLLREVESCRKLIAELWRVPATRIGFATSSAEAMAHLARGLDWRRGDNVVTTALEFPSVGWAWRNLQAEGVEIRRVAHREFKVCEEDLIDAVDARTRVMSVSQVSFYNGQQLDISTLADALSGGETLLAVDATHASGAIQVAAGLADICMSSSYKWLLATTGVAPFYLSERAESLITPSAYGWRNLQLSGVDFATTPDQRSDVVAMPQRFEAGNPALYPILALANGLRTILDIGIEKIDRHVRELSAEVSDVFAELGLETITPYKLEQRSGNTSYRIDNAEAHMDALAEYGVLVWGGEGRLRVSTHLYNSSEDIGKLADALRQVIRDQR